MGETAEQIRIRIEQTRNRLGEDLNALEIQGKTGDGLALLLQPQPLGFRRCRLWPRAARGNRVRQ
jgi:hypothetical protein